jgi:hypothetical protein
MNLVTGRLLCLTATWLSRTGSRVTRKNSGLSLIGTNNVDESICAIFDYLREEGEEPRLVNVPEFVVNNVQYPEMFNFKSERCYDEYLLAVKDHYPVENMKSIWRRKVMRRLSDLKKHKVDAQSLDLSRQENKDLLLQALTSWQSRNINNYGKLEQLAVERGIRDAEQLGIEDICLFVDDELHGFCTYTLSEDKKLATLYCVKATHKKALGYELMLHLFAKWFAEHHVEHVNLNADYGLLRLRMFMLTFGPMDFNRKYTVEPREGNEPA